MKKLIFGGMMLIMANSAYAGCYKVNEAELAGMERPELHKTLCRYYKDLRAEVKITNAQILAGSSAQNKNQEVCQDEITKIERIYVKRFNQKVPECP